MNTTRRIVSALVAASLFASVSLTSFANSGPVDATKSKSPALDLARQLNQAFIEVAEKVSPAVVVITVSEKAEAPTSRGEEGSYWDNLPDELRRFFEEHVPQNRGRQPQQRRAPRSGRGSGIVLSEDGYIVTNNHVVEDADKIKVRFRDGREFSAEVKGRDPLSDMAVIKINGVKNLAYAKFGDSNAARVGEFVIAIGAPFELDYTVTVGHISAKGRGLPELTMMAGQYADQNFIQTDASINPGNSGGPLVNLYGEVIGINTAIRGIGTGLGFAVPSTIARQVSDRLIKDGKFTRSRIGIEIRDLREDPETKPDFLEQEDGVVVRGILEGGPAANSDLRAGDVVVAVDGQTVKTSGELKEHVAYKKPGDTVTLDVLRSQGQGKPKTLKVKVKTEAVPDDKVASNGNNRSGSGGAETGSFGLAVKSLTADLADEFGVDEKEGVIVTAVESGSVADEKGMKPGDIITEVNRQPVTNLRQFREVMKTADKKKGVVINFISKGTKRFTVLRED